MDQLQTRISLAFAVLPQSALFLLPRYASRNIQGLGMIWKVGTSRRLAICTLNMLAKNILLTLAKRRTHIIANPTEHFAHNLRARCTVFQGKQPAFAVG